MDSGRLSWTHIQPILRGRFGSRFLGIHCVFIGPDHVIVDSVFDVSRDVRTAEDPLIVRLIFCEEERDISLTIQIPFTKLCMRCGNGLSTLLATGLFQGRLGSTGPPCPGVTEPERW